MNKFAIVVLASALTLAACGKQEAAPAPVPAAEPAAAAPAETAPAPAADAAAPAAEVAAAPAGAVDGEKIYKGTCSMCHATGAAGAPIKGNKTDWAPRIAQGNDMLYKHALEGFTGQKGMMPARGGMASLKDEEVKAAVDFMVAQSK